MSEPGVNCQRTCSMSVSSATVQRIRIRQPKSGCGSSRGDHGFRTPLERANRKRTRNVGRWNGINMKSKRVSEKGNLSRNMITLLGIWGCMRRAGIASKTLKRKSENGQADGDK